MTMQLHVLPMKKEAITMYVLLKKHESTCSIFYKVPYEGQETTQLSLDQVEMRDIVSRKIRLLGLLPFSRS